MSYIQPKITDNFSAALALHSIKQDRAIGLSTLSLKTLRQVQAYQRQVLGEIQIQFQAEQLHSIIETGKRDIEKIKKLDKAGKTDKRMLVAMALFVSECVEIATAGLEEMAKVTG